MPRVRRASLLMVALSALVTASACSPGRPAADVWAMPTLDAQDHRFPLGGGDGPGYAHARLAGVDTGTPALATVGELPDFARLERGGFWRLEEGSARREAGRTRRGVLVDFYAEWCEPCIALQRGVFGDPDVKQAIFRDFVPLRIDVTEETFRGREQLERYRINRLPTIVLLDARGREVDRIDGLVSADHILQRLSFLHEGSAKRQAKGCAEAGQLSGCAARPRAPGRTRAPR